MGLEGYFGLKADSLMERAFGEESANYQSASPKLAIRMKGVTLRRNLIRWRCTTGCSVTDIHFLMAFSRTVGVCSGLLQMNVAGIKMFYCPPETGEYLTDIPFIKQAYSGTLAKFRMQS